MERIKMFTGTVVAGAAACVLFAGVGLARMAGAETRATLPASLGDLSRASSVEVKDGAGRVVLRGAFGAEAADKDGDRERKAALAPSAGPAKGEAEIEVSAKDAPVVELEVDVEGLAAGQTFTVHVDGVQAATLTTDAGGGAEVELVAGSKQ
jgi:hypothetical protein